MRIALLVALGLAACAPQRVVYSSPPLSPEQQAAQDARQMRPMTADEMAAAVQERQVAEARSASAAVICRERGNLAASAPAYGGPGTAGAINAGLQLGWAASNAEASCWRTYQATGILPTY